MQKTPISSKKHDFRYILGMRVDATSYEEATSRIMSLSRQKHGSYVSVANVHMTMETWDDENFRKIVNESELVTPDGMPLVWALRALGVNNIHRVYGPTLTLHICEAAASEKIPIALYGGTVESLEDFHDFLENTFPGINIVCKISPPFRTLSRSEDEAFTQEIVNSGAQIVFVGIGCPKQEHWMADHKRQIPATMVGVGAAFDFHSGRVKQSPHFLQKIGLEWCFRLFMEPRRLWKRYIYNNPRFVLLFLFQHLRISAKSYNDNTDLG